MKISITVSINIYQKELNIVSFRPISRKEIIVTILNAADNDKK